MKNIQAGYYVIIGIVILVLGGLFVVGGISGGSGALPLVGVGVLIIAVVVATCSDAVKDHKEGIIRNNGSADYRKILEMEWDIKKKYSDPKCKACQDELKALHARVVYGPRR